MINPDDIVKQYGADVLRLYEMFMGPLEAVKPWQTEQLIGSVRFRDRIYNLFNKPRTNDKPDEELTRTMHKFIKKATGDLEKMSFNTVISQCMIFSNALRELKTPIPKQALEALALCLSPIAPHLCEECWEILGMA